MEKLEGFQSIITEQDLLELLGLKRSTLDKLRLKEGFPFVKLSDKSRVYLESDVLAWLRKRTIIIQPE